MAGRLGWDLQGGGVDIRLNEEEKQGINNNRSVSEDWTKQGFNRKEMGINETGEKRSKMK